MPKLKHTKLKKAPAIAVTALQIPLLLLRKIPYDAVKLDSRALKIVGDGSYKLVFEWELFGWAFWHICP